MTEPAEPPEQPGPPGLAEAVSEAEQDKPFRWRRLRADRRELAAIFAGGAIGTLARAGLSEAFPHSPTSWPWPTFTVNVVAAFVLGCVVTRLQERLPLSAYRRPLLGTGLCGGLSTFSTMQVEIVGMIDAHAWFLAAGYIGASIAAGYAAVRIATAWVRRVRVRVQLPRPGRRSGTGASQDDAVTAGAGSAR